jgi:hypothetical protein
MLSRFFLKEICPIRNKLEVDQLARLKTASELEKMTAIHN